MKVTILWVRYPSWNYLKSSEENNSQEIPSHYVSMRCLLQIKPVVRSWNLTMTSLAFCWIWKEGPSAQNCRQSSSIGTGRDCLRKPPCPRSRPSQRTPMTDGRGVVYKGLTILAPSGRTLTGHFRSRARHGVNWDWEPTWPLSFSAPLSLLHRYWS